MVYISGDSLAAATPDPAEEDPVQQGAGYPSVWGLVPVVWSARGLVPVVWSQWSALPRVWSQWSTMQAALLVMRWRTPSGFMNRKQAEAIGAD